MLMYGEHCALKSVGVYVEFPGFYQNGTAHSTIIHIQIDLRHPLMCQSRNMFEVIVKIKLSNGYHSQECV